jgi:hypothetical protein
VLGGSLRCTAKSVLQRRAGLCQASQRLRRDTRNFVIVLCVCRAGFCLEGAQEVEKLLLLAVA